MASPQRAYFRPPLPYVFEVLPVPADLVDRYWYDIDLTCRSHFRRRVKDPRQKEFNTQALYARATAGIDLIWIVAGILPDRPSQYWGVIVTSITDRPPSKRRLFWRDPAALRSITIHLLNGQKFESWIDLAVERITAYAQQNDCRQAFLMARRNWQEYAARFVGPAFRAVGFTRDRQSSQGQHHQANRIGWYRELVPLPPDGNRGRMRQHMAYSKGVRSHVSDSP